MLIIVQRGLKLTLTNSTDQKGEKKRFVEIKHEYSIYPLTKIQIKFTLDAIYPGAEIPSEVYPTTERMVDGWINSFIDYLRNQNCSYEKIIVHKY